MAIKQPALILERDRRKKKKESEVTPKVNKPTKEVVKNNKGTTRINRATISTKPGTQNNTQNRVLTNKDRLTSKPTISNVNKDIMTIKTSNKAKRSIQTVDVYERGGNYYYKDGKKEKQVDTKFVQNALNNNRSGVIGRYNSKGKLVETDERGNVKSAKGIRKEKVKNLSKQLNAMKDDIKNGKMNASQAITDVANIADAATDYGVGKFYKNAYKTGINAFDRLWTGSTKSLEGVMDTANDLTTEITSRQNYLINRLSGMSKKDAAKQMKQEQQANAEWVKRDLVNDFKEKTGYNDIQPSLEEGSLITKDNLAGKVLEGAGGMLPALAVGQYANLGLAAKSTEGLTGLQKAGTVLGNMGRGFANQAGANTILGAQSYGSGIEEAYGNGATGKQARLYGLLNAATELGTEWITGGIPGTKSEGVLDNIIGSLIDKKTAKISNRYVSNVVNAVVKSQAKGIGEGFEEALAEIINPQLKNLTYSNGEKIDWNQVKDSALSGYFIGMLLNSPETVTEIKQGIDDAKLPPERKQQLKQELDEYVEQAKVRNNTADGIDEETAVINMRNQLQQQANEVAERVNSGEIDVQEGNALLDQVRDGTYQQNRNLEQIATQRKAMLEEQFRQGQINQGEYIQGVQALANTVNQTREEINGTKEQVVEQPRLSLNEEQQNVKETMPNLSKSGLIYNDKIPTKNLKAPEGYTILYHNTTADNLESISKEGIKGSERLDAYKASPEEGEAIWASKEPQKGNGGSTVAFIVPNEVAQNSRVNNDEFMLYDNISPENIVQIDRGLKNGIQMSDLERLAKQSKNEESFVRGAEKVGLDENSAKEIYNTFGNKSVANNKEISYNDNSNNTQHVTVAPYFNTPMLSSMENLDELKAEAQKPFFKKASEIAKDIGVSISDIKVNMGGYEFEGGGSVNELSYTFELPNADTTQADMFAVRLGEEGYEKQESVIALEYLDESSTNDNGIALRIKVKNLDNIAQILKEENLLNYSVEIENKVIQFVDIYDFHDADFENKIESLIRKLGDNYEKQSWRKVNSRYIDGETKQSVKEAWQRTNDLRQRSERTSGNSESKTTKELDNSFSNEKHKNIGKHYGDLGKARDTNHFSISGSRRGTGHFGTGTYFVTEDYEVGPDSTYAKRPVKTADFDDYNLAKPQTEQDGFDLHDALKQINYNNNPISEELYNKLLPYYEASFGTTNDLLDEESFNDYKNIRNLLEEAGVETEEFDGGSYGDYERDLEDKITDVLNDYDRFKTAEKDLKRILNIDDSQFEKAIESVRDTSEKYKNYTYDEKLKADSLSTKFMKGLGYEGIDVRHLKALNNTEYGSVIYDLKQPSTSENITAKTNENVITIKNDNLKGVPKDQIKGEDTGVSIDGKQVQMQIPIDSKPNKLGQYVPKDGFTKKELKSGKLGDSKFYKNVTERADFIRDEVREKVKDDDYVKHYRKVTNDESMQEAFNDLNTRGTEAIADFFNKEEELTAKDTAMGWLLIEQSQENGDYDFSTQVLRKLRSNATKTAQTLQMYNYYARLTPEGMYKWCGDQLLRAEEIFEKNKTKKWIENNKKRWQLNAEETNFIKSQMERVQELNKMDDNDITTIEIGKKGKTKEVTVERAKQVEIAKIQAMIENKIPPEKGQALNAWMRISMLGNLKTIGTRNPMGNIALRPINDVGDIFASAADFAISKVTGVRTKGTFNAKAQVKGFAKGGSETFQDAKLGINTRNAKGNRFEIGNGKSFNEQHTGVGKVLNPFAKAGNWMDSKVSFLLDLGDRPFYEASAQQSLENQMRLNGIEKLEDVPDWMKKIAETEGFERTYQDDNSYTQSVIAIRNAMNTFNIKGYGLGDVIIPFAKTPANLTKAIVDYSPAGFVNAITKGKNLKNSIQNGQFTPEMQHAFVNQLGKATAGTILYAIGAALSKAGITTGGDDEDKDLADFMKNTLGIQPYSIKIGDKSFTYDWAQPVASGLAIPADIRRGIQDAKEGEVDLQYIIHNAFSSGGKVLLEQSFLQGIKDVLGGYGDPLDNLMSEIEGLPARAVPTLFQQIVTYLDGTKRMSYGNKGTQNAIAQAQAKTPWAKDLPVYRNSLGKAVKMYGGKNNFFNVFINPANYSQGNATETAKEIYRVYQATNKKDVLPRLVDNSLKDEDGKKLTNQQKSDFLKISGDIIEENVGKMMNEKKYKDMSDDEKAEKIKAIVGYSYNKARKEITGHKLSGANKSAEKAREAGYSIADYFLDKTKTAKKTSKERNRYKEMNKIGIDGTTYTEFKNFVNSDKARGESRTGGLSKRQKVINYIQSLPLSAKQKQSLYDDWNNNQKFFTYYN